MRLITENLTHYQAKDMILQFICDNEGNNCGTARIKRDLLTSVDDSMILNLVTQIIEHPSRIVGYRTSKFDAIIWANERTKLFLSHGGFTKINDDENQLADNDALRYSLEIENLRTNIKVNTKNNWLIVPTFIASIIAIIIGIAAYFKS